MGGHSKPVDTGGSQPSPVEDSRNVREEMDSRHPPKAYGKHPHKVEWGPQSMTVYGDLNNPFYYRTPTGKKGLELPAHVPQNPMNLEIHLRDPRQRVFMTQAERDWRRKWILDQNLHEEEPYFVADTQFYINPIRRLYRYPMDLLGTKVLYPKFGAYYGTQIRRLIPMAFMVAVGAGSLYYYLKYNRKTWHNLARPTVNQNGFSLGHYDEIEKAHPGLVAKAYPEETSQKDFTDNGFSQRRVFLNLGESNRPW